MSAAELPPAAAALERAVLEEGLAGTRFEDRLVLLDGVDSTIEECRRLAEEGAPEGTVVLAEEQRCGRGRRGRSWHSPRGLALYLTVLLRPGPALAPERAADLVGLSGLAAFDALRSACPVELRLKAPNDLLALGGDGRPRKLGGLLVDTAVQGRLLRHALVSLGLNVNQAESDFPPGLRAWASSLRIETGRPWRREPIAAAFLRRLEVAARDLALGRLEAWRSRWEAEASEEEGFTAPAWCVEETT